MAGAFRNSPKGSMRKSSPVSFRLATFLGSMRRNELNTKRICSTKGDTMAKSMQQERKVEKRDEKKDERKE